jgi:hypothetical protein
MEECWDSLHSRIRRYGKEIDKKIEESTLEEDNGYIVIDTLEP